MKGEIIPFTWVYGVFIVILNSPLIEHKRNKGTFKKPFLYLLIQSILKEISLITACCAPRGGLSKTVTDQLGK